MRIALTGTDPRQISLKKKKELCDRYTELLKSVDSRITTTSVRYEDSAQRVILATSEGSFIEQSWVDMEMRFAATAKNGETVQTGRETTGSRKAFEDLMGLDEQVKEAAQRAVAALSLPSVKAILHRGD
jgi:TldD protein